LTNRDDEIFAALKAAEELRNHALDVKALADRIDAARNHMAYGVHDLLGHQATLSDRIVWIIRELDDLRAQVLALGLPK
jgi:hypothetical protein